MTHSSPIVLLVYCIHILLLPLLLVGIIRSTKARLQNRRGPSVLQPFWDIFKQIRKGETVSDTTTWLFRLTPVVNLAILVTVSLMVPWLGLPSPVQGDLFLVIYLLVMGKFLASLSSLDAGSAFGALGASREASVSIQSEPAMLVALVVLAFRAQSSSFNVIFEHAPSQFYSFIILPLISVSIALTIMADLARMPFDDPTTHLELTMIHEARILENSGRNLALVELASSLKLALLLGIFVQAVLAAVPMVSLWMDYILTIILLLVTAAALGVVETLLVKLRWRRIPNLLSFALAASLLACMVVSMRGR